MASVASALAGLSANTAGNVSNQAAWAGWNNIYYQTASNAATVIWTEWNQQYSSGSCQTVTQYQTAISNMVYLESGKMFGSANTQPALSAEEVQRLNEQSRLAQEQIVAQHAESQRKAKEAEAKAMALLMEHLDAGQREEFKKDKTFTVHTRNGERQYKVRYGKAGNVKLIRNGKEVESYCIHPVVPCPTEDVMLTQKLLLEADEEQFLKIANKTVLAA